MKDEELKALRARCTTVREWQSLRRCGLQVVASDFFDEQQFADALSEGLHFPKVQCIRLAAVLRNKNKVQVYRGHFEDVEYRLEVMRDLLKGYELAIVD